jgi:hypothetical protein
MARIKDELKETTAVALADDKLLPAAPATDNWDAVPEAGNSLIVGTMIKYGFNEKTFYINGAEADPSDTYAVLDVVVAWVRWGAAGGKPEHRITKPGQHHPEREELPDQNEEEWQIGRDGKPEDPWKDNRYVLVVNTATAAEFTFVTDTVGGRRAISDLKNEISKARRSLPGAIPIVKLISTTMPTSYGIKPRPGFKVEGWHGGTAPAPAPSDEPKQPVRRYAPDSITSGRPQPDNEPPPHNEVPPDRDFDDIPF